MENFSSGGTRLGEPTANTRPMAELQRFTDLILFRDMLELTCSESTFFSVRLHQLSLLLGYAKAELLHWNKINVVTSNGGSLLWDCSVEELSLNIEKIIHSITIHLCELTMVYRIAMFSTATLLLFYNIIELSWTRHKLKGQQRGSALIPSFLVFGTNSGQQHFLWRAFLCLSKSLGVIQKQCSEDALCVHPPVILSHGAEIVEDDLELGRKAEISSIEFQQVVWKSDE